MNYFDEGNLYYAKKEYKKALSLYEKAFEIRENEPDALYNAAVCHIKLKEYTAAIELLNKALSLKSDSKYYFNLAYCYAHSLNNKKALIYFNTAWALNPEDEDCDKAINLILKKLRKEPTN